jgi:TonB family protein
MPTLIPPPNPAPPREKNSTSEQNQPVKVRAGRFGELEEQEIIHLIDSLDDERSRGRFRESIYISVIFYLALAWFVLYGPRVLFHQPQLKDPFAEMEHERLTHLEAPRLHTPPPRTTLDNKTIKQLQQQAPRPTPPAPTAAPPTPAPEVAHNAPAPTPAPPVENPRLALPNGPKPAPPLVDAPSPTPNVAQQSPQTAHSAIQDAIRAAGRGQSGAQYGNAPTPAGKNLGAGAEVLSDTQGVDFSAYLRRVIADTKRNWEPLIPEEVQAPLLKKGIVGVRFTILPDGSIGNMILETRSGDRALDEAAWNAIRSEGKFQPLPREFHGPQLELRFGFFYNVQPPQ